MDSLLEDIGDFTSGCANICPKDVVQETASQLVKFQERSIRVSEVDALQIGKDVGSSQSWCGQSDTVGHGINVGRYHAKKLQYMQVFAIVFLAIQPQ